MATNSKTYGNCWEVEKKNGKNGNLTRKQDEKERFEALMIEMFGHTFDRLTIQDVLFNHEYNVDKCVESLLKMSDDTSSFKKKNDPFEKIAFSIIKDDENENQSDENFVLYAEGALQSLKSQPRQSQSEEKKGLMMSAAKVPGPSRALSTPSKAGSPPTNYSKTLLTLTEAQVLLDHHRNRGHKLLILLRGCPGSGKTTMARQLNYNGVILSTDDYFYRSNDSYTFDATFLSEAHSLNANRTAEFMQQGTSTIIIDNTNTQSWQMLPYVKLAVDHGYKVEVIEPKTAWRFKPGKLAKLNQHSVSLEKIKRIIDAYEHNVTAESLLQMIDSKRHHTRPIDNSHHIHSATQLHSSPKRAHANNNTKNNNKNNKINNKKFNQQHKIDNKNNNQTNKSVSDNNITIRANVESFIGNHGEQVSICDVANFSGEVSCSNRYFYLKQMNDMSDNENCEVEMIGEKDVIEKLKIPTNNVDSKASTDEELKIDSLSSGYININEMPKIEKIENEFIEPGDNDCDNITCENRNDLKEGVIEKNSLEDKGWERNEADKVIDNEGIVDVQDNDHIEKRERSRERIREDKSVKSLKEYHISKGTSTEPRDWLVVGHMTTNEIEEFENFKLIQSNLIFESTLVLFYNENDTKESSRKENEASTEPKQPQKQIVMNRAKDSRTWHYTEKPKSYQDSTKQDSSAQTEEEDDDDDWKGLLDHFSHVDKDRLKQLYYCCNRSIQLLTHIISDFEPRVSDNETKKTDPKLPDKNDKTNYDKTDSNGSEKKHNKNFKASTAYVYKSASSKGIVDSINSRVFNPSTKYKDSIRRTDVVLNDEVEERAVEHSLEVTSQTAYNIWKMLSNEDIVITGDVMLKLDDFTAQSLHRSLKDALNIISTNYISSQSEHLATRIKFNNLCNLFPNINKDVLHNIFQASGYSQEVCASVVQTSGLNQPAIECMTEDFKQKLELSLLQQAIDASLQNHERRGEPVEMTLSTDLDSTYQAILQQASHTQHLVSQLREQGKKALRDKNYGVYSNYSERLNEMMEKLKEEKNLAAEILFQKKFDIGQGVLDLHGFTCEEVSNKLPIILHFQMQRVQKGSKRRGHLSIITGRGKNSAGGVAKIKPLVINYLKKNNYSFKLTTPGIVKVFLTG